MLVLDGLKILWLDLNACGKIHVSRECAFFFIFIIFELDNAACSAM